MSQGGSSLPDYAHIRAAVAPIAANCKNPTAVFRVTVVKSTESRQKGLGGRQTPLASDEGMLFIFDPAAKVTFWMKDTLIPLEIAFFDGKGTLTQLYEMPVEADPTNPVQRYNSRYPTAGALELPPGAIKSLKPRSSELCLDTVAPNQ